MRKGFASDNYAGVLPEMLEAIQDANNLHARSYGNDDFTQKAKQQFVKQFGCDVETTFVFNGTGANVLAIGCAVQSFNAVLCADSSHLYVDESTAPETFTGCRFIPLQTNKDGKIEIETIRKNIIRKGDEHFPQIRVLSIAQPTEYGTVYSIKELTEISEILKENGLVFHVDGARLFNAISYLNCSIKEMTADVGVDILSVGGTKTGLLFGEAIVFFNKELAQNLRFRQKQSTQLPSKMRFIAAQFTRLLETEIWKKAAAHSNKMAQILFDSIKQIPQIQITRTVQANSVFAIIPKEWNEPLMEISPFYVWNENTNEVRWMCSFDTNEQDIEEFTKRISELSEYKI